MDYSKGRTWMISLIMANGVRLKAQGKTFLKRAKIDELVKSQKIAFPVIPAKAGIQCFRMVMTGLDPGFRRGDDFLRVHQSLQGIRL